MAIKFNNLRSLAGRGAHVLVLPAATPPEQVLAYNPTASSCPTDRATRLTVPYVYENIREWSASAPCSASASATRCWGWPWAARLQAEVRPSGANQPVKDLTHGRIEITSQNTATAWTWTAWPARTCN
jgi:carbamoyl-phosphate synthase small subunit